MGTGRLEGPATSQTTRKASDTEAVPDEHVAVGVLIHLVLQSRLSIQAQYYTKVNYLSDVAGLYLHSAQSKVSTDFTPTDRFCTYLPVADCSITLK